MDINKLTWIGIILNELFTNIMKYSFTGRDSGTIEVSLTEKNGSLVLTILDNGNGLYDGFDLSKSTGFGLKLVTMLSEQLEGNFFIENSNGTKSTLIFKV